MSPATKQSRLAAGLCVRDGRPLSPREVGKVQRCRRCRMEESAKQKVRNRREAALS